MSSFMHWGLSPINWTTTGNRSKRLHTIQEEDLHELLAQCEDDDNLRPMPVQSTNDDSDGLPWFVNCILRIFNKSCCNC